MPADTHVMRENQVVKIRPAATLLLVRDGADGVEVMTLRRSAGMRFLPGYIAFPGGAVDETDWSLGQVDPGKPHVVAAENIDDPVYAVAALRECAEEVGWVCSVQKPHGERLPDYRLTPALQEQLLTGQLAYHQLLRANEQTIDFSRLRFVGRWVTPPHMPARFDTRFFIYGIPHREATRLEAPLVNPGEIEWARWQGARHTLEQVQRGHFDAVAPTIAMLEALCDCASYEECLASLHVPGPSVQD